MMALVANCKILTLAAVSGVRQEGSSVEGTWEFTKIRGANMDPNIL